MTEADIHVTLVGLLRGAGVLAFHPANEFVPRDPRKRAAVLAKRHRMGVEPGMPDLVILTPPPSVPGAPGAVLEIKSDRGRPTAQQRVWLDTYTELGWASAWAAGLKPCIAQLIEWGYPVMPPTGPT